MLGLWYVDLGTGMDLLLLPLVLVGVGGSRGARPHLQLDPRLASRAPPLAERGPYLVVVVELPSAGNVRMIGNLLGDTHQPVPIAANVRAVFEHHDHGESSFTLLQWQRA